MYTVKLEKFEGPLDLLLSLIEEQKMDVCEVSLGQVTDQYLEYIKSFQEAKPRGLADFLVVAARLILIKSRALLPLLKITEEEEEDIYDLEERLREYKKFKDLAKKLKALSEKNNFFYSREAFLNVPHVFFPPENIEAGNLALAIQKIIDSIPKPEELPEEEIEQVVSIEEKIKDIQTRIKSAVMKFSEITADAESKVDVIVSFLAALELVRHNFIFMEQNEIFGEITLKQTKEEEFSFINL